MTKSSSNPLREIWQLLKDFAALASTPEGRRFIGAELEDSLRRTKIGGAILDKVRLMYDYYRDPAEPAGAKWLMGGALLYLIVPNDLFPDWIPLVGLLDDAAVIAYVWNQVKDILFNYEARRAQRRG